MKLLEHKSVALFEIRAIFVLEFDKELYLCLIVKFSFTGADGVYYSLV